MHRHATGFLCTAVAALAACAPAPVERDTPPPSTSASRATANLAPASASLVSGTLTLTTMGDGVHVGGEIGGLPPGAHGFHVHDTDNIFANAEGVAPIDTHLNDVTLGSGLANDIAGRAIIVHADPDDYTSQPSGDAGARVACGVIAVIR